MTRHPKLAYRVVNNELLHRQILCVRECLFELIELGHIGLPLGAVISLLVVRNLGTFGQLSMRLKCLFVRHASGGPCSVMIHTGAGAAWVRQLTRVDAGAGRTCYDGRIVGRTVYGANTSIWDIDSFHL
jgi:hypothetical protein